MSNTRIIDMANQALAASKYASMEVDADMDMDFSDSDSEEEEDYELFNVSEAGMRPTALDACRHYGCHSHSRT